MTPTPFVPEPYTPREAANRLYLLCDELEQRHVPADVVTEIRTLSERFTRHLQELPVFCERLERLAQSMRP
jgi:D-serine deaminase-like pyridoxal phosphate-dependent protein